MIDHCLLCCKRTKCDKVNLLRKLIFQQPFISSKEEVQEKFLDEDI